tara:strand:+ start:861 stop:1019 length:159 start_codon:yes stop_codon:yes gene_type:complete
MFTAHKKIFENILSIILDNLLIDPKLFILSLQNFNYVNYISRMLNGYLHVMV